HALLDLAVAHYAWDRGDGFPGSAVFTAAADEVQTSGTLAFYAGRGLLTAEDYERAVDALKKALALDESFTLSAYFLAEAELRREPPRFDQAIRNYELFLSTPDQHRIGNPAAQRQLMDDARAKVAELRRRGLQ
ncbi:MAG: hypothetical protein KFH87_01960, partial [Bacteroidetes bacterium]|nr:hypothetical protein [Bacteroidota bacterium]